MTHLANTVFSMRQVLIYHLEGIPNDIPVWRNKEEIRIICSNNHLPYSLQTA